MLLTHSDLFVPVDLKRRVFRKVPKHNLRERLMFVAHGGADALDEVGPGIRENAFDAAPVAQIVVDDDDRLVLANQEARDTFGLHPSDIGRPIKDVEVSYRPVELRAHLEQVRTEHQVLRLANVIWRPPNGEPRRLDVQITPLVSGGAALGASITYLDVTEPLRLREDGERAKRELDAAYEELQSTVEELETTNEELQSTNEELETTNEELQSTNEELETMNEELQSANEELETINDELRQRSLEIDEVNSFLEAILTSMGVAVVVVDRQQVVQVWNDQAEDLWGVRSEEAVGHHFLSLDIGLPLESVKQALRSALSDPEAREEMLVPATNRRGQSIECRVACLPLTRAGGEITGAIVLMDPVPAAEPAAQRTEA
jgi:two-component system CheB/CheR fusion protein